MFYDWGVNWLKCHKTPKQLLERQVDFANGTTDSTFRQLFRTFNYVQESATCKESQGNALILCGR